MSNNTDIAHNKKIARSINILPQYLLPHFAVTKLMYWIMHSNIRWLKHALIHWFVNRYKVDMSQAENEDLSSYKNFNQFFTRPIKKQLRPVCAEQNCIACPVDGSISQLGIIEDNKIFQAKGHSFSLDALLAYQTPWVDYFRDGQFATIYLSPKDYHRIHMPIDATLKQMSYIPGTLFSVSPMTTQMIPDLFSRNERVACFFETAFGPMALVLVGAMIVGSIETTWQGRICPPHGKETKHWQYNLPHKVAGSGPYLLRKGDEMGRFNMGSTVILLFNKNTVRWNAELSTESLVQMGMNIATIAG